MRCVRLKLRSPDACGRSLTLDEYVLPVHEPFGLGGLVGLEGGAGLVQNVLVGGEEFALLRQFVGRGIQPSCSPRSSRSFGS